ncbi:MAG: ROK family transcriptional regulator [Sphaerochaetaceae bacterium]|jgi:predicted NBD/HSP70 family sugar kinase/predicted transcriptional regulator|nr:ROK family transcriptional regulator [Sphaerochaetaceae bacterium]MDD4842630.1 ROK family transcriptional regulator [Sphaerochaetaceae bacterium]
MHYISLSQTVNPAYQLIINQSAVFHYLREHGPTYRNQIANALNISLPSVARALKALVERDFVELVDYRRNDQARTVPYYRITIKDTIMLSLDLLKGAIAAQDLSGLFSIGYFKLDKEKNVVEDLVSIITDYVHDNLKRPLSSVKSICIGSPGIVDVDEGVVLKAIFHPGLEHVQLKKALSDHFDCLVFIDNVVNIAAYANYWEFSNEISNIISCDLGLEIGTGLLIDGHIHRGAHYMAGETGYFTDNIDNPTINYKRTRTFRTICCEMARLLENREVDITALDEDYCLNKTAELFESAFQGNPIANQILNEYIDKIIVMLNKVDVLLNPELIVIGGDICQMPHSELLFLQRLNDRYKPLRQMRQDICYSKYGPLVTLYGAGQMALEQYFFEEFPYMMGNGT